MMRRPTIPTTEVIDLTGDDDDDDDDYPPPPAAAAAKATTSTDSTDSTDYDLTCPICFCKYTLLSKKPMLIVGCKHPICDLCYRMLEPKSCPTCRAPNSVVEPDAHILQAVRSSPATAASAASAFSVSFLYSGRTYVVPGVSNDWVVQDLFDGFLRCLLRAGSQEEVVSASGILMSTNFEEDIDVVHLSHLHALRSYGGMPIARLGICKDSAEVKVLRLAGPSSPNYPR
jgi:hypothetical protein